MADEESDTTFHDLPLPSTPDVTPVWPDDVQVIQPDPAEPRCQRERCELEHRFEWLDSKSGCNATLMCLMQGRPCADYQLEISYAGQT